MLESILIDVVKLVGVVIVQSAGYGASDEDVQ